jgi:hypothetical protein
MIDSNMVSCLWPWPDLSKPFKTFQNRVREDTPDAITLVTGPHAEIRIPRKQIVSIKPSSVSLMPEGLDESLTRPEFIDLLSFLQAQKSREIAQVRNP